MKVDWQVLIGCIVAPALLIGAHIWATKARAQNPPRYVLPNESQVIRKIGTNLAVTRFDDRDNTCYVTHFAGDFSYRGYIAISCVRNK